MGQTPRRDEAKEESRDEPASDPDRFDITRQVSGHLAFGLGIHSCVGKPVARIEGEALLGALARKVGRIELDCEPRRHLNNTIRSFESLPVTFHAP